MRYEDHSGFVDHWILLRRGGSDGRANDSRFEGIYADFYDKIDQSLTRVILAIGPTGWMLDLVVCGLFVVLKDRWLRNRRTINVTMSVALVLLIGMAVWGLFLPVFGDTSHVSG